MSTRSFKNVYKSYTPNVYKPGLALNNLQRLLYQKTQQTKPETLIKWVVFFCDHVPTFSFSR